MSFYSDQWLGVDLAGTSDGIKLKMPSGFMVMCVSLAGQGIAGVLSARIMLRSNTWSTEATIISVYF